MDDNSISPPGSITAAAAAPILLGLQFGLLVMLMTSLSRNEAHRLGHLTLWVAFSIATLVICFFMSLRHHDPWSIAAPVLSLAMIEFCIVHPLFI